MAVHGGEFSKVVNAPLKLKKSISMYEFKNLFHSFCHTTFIFNLNKIQYNM